MLVLLHYPCGHRSLEIPVNSWTLGRLRQEDRELKVSLTLFTVKHFLKNTSTHTKIVIKMKIKK